MIYRPGSIPIRVVRPHQLEHGYEEYTMYMCIVELEMTLNTTSAGEGRQLKYHGHLYG